MSRLVQADPPEPELVADAHLAQVADGDGRVVAHGEHRGANVVQVGNQAQAAHDEHLRTTLDIRAARVLVAGAERVGDLLEGKLIALELERIDEHLILLGRPAEADTSTTPGTVRNCRSTTQSSSALSSVRG